MYLFFTRHVAILLIFARGFARSRLLLWCLEPLGGVGCLQLTEFCTFQEVPTFGNQEGNALHEDTKTMGSKDDGWDY